MDTYKPPYRMQLYLPDELRDRLRSIVAAEQTTQQALLVAWIEKNVAQYEQWQQKNAGRAPAQKG